MLAEQTTAYRNRRTSASEPRARMPESEPTAVKMHPAAM